MQRRRYFVVVVFVLCRCRFFPFFNYLYRRLHGQISHWGIVSSSQLLLDDDNNKGAADHMVL